MKGGIVAAKGGVRKEGHLKAVYENGEGEVEANVLIGIELLLNMS